MAEIRISAAAHDDRWACAVKVVEGDTSTDHLVNVKTEDYIRLTDKKISVEELVKKSFEFLLEREPKESILGNFDLMVINDYFPEYEEEIKN